MRNELEKLQQENDPEKILISAANALSSKESCSPEELVIVCNALCRAGRATWWRCGCGEILPTSGDIDAFCVKCRQMRSLPNRLSRSPWGLYVRALQQLMPDYWFEKLSEWMKSNQIGEMMESELSNAKTRRIKCIDGMIIDETGDVRGLQWIALPMMDVNGE